MLTRTMEAEADRLNGLYLRVMIMARAQPIEF